MNDRMPNSAFVLGRCAECGRPDRPEEVQLDVAGAFVNCADCGRTNGVRMSDGRAVPNEDERNALTMGRAQFASREGC